VRYGIPVGEDDYVFLGFAADHTSLKTTSFSAQRYQDYVNKYGPNSNTWSTTLGWQKDKRDSATVPTKGIYRRVNLEIAMPGSTTTYIRGTVQQQQFTPLSDTFTLMLNGEFDIAKAYGSREVPFFKNFYAGGIGSVRGFQSNGLGPRDLLTNDPLGGTKKLLGSTELLFPLPGAMRDRSFRLSVFADAGGLWGYDEKFSLGDLRYSTGMAVSWNSPMGPLKLSFAKPLNDKANDKTQAVQFQFGSIF